jgi:hypothetical protein
LLEIKYDFDLSGTGVDTSVVIENISGFRYLDIGWTPKEYQFFAANGFFPCSSASADSGRVKISFKYNSSPIGLKKVHFIIRGDNAKIKVRAFSGTSGSKIDGVPATGGKQYIYDNASVNVDYFSIACMYESGVDPLSDAIYSLINLHIPSNPPVVNPPTNLELDPTTVSEGLAPGAYTGILTTTDPDDPAGTGIYTYELIPGYGDNGSFSITGNILTNLVPFDYDTNPDYNVSIRTTDVTGAFLEKTFTISLAEIPENNPPTDISLSALSINENMPCGSVVGTLTTTDPDSGDSHTYSLVAGTGDTDNSRFSIVNNRLLTGAIFNFEANSSYSIRVRSTDGSGNPFEKQFSIEINDILTETTPEIVCLLDMSGSMNLDFNYQWTTDPIKIKLNQTKNSILGFIDVLYSLRPQAVSVGLARFPSYPWSGNCDAANLKPVNILDAAYKADLDSYIPGLSAEGNTPMLAGIDVARNMFISGSRKVIVLLSDGAHNCPTWNIQTSTINSYTETLRNAGISMYTIGFGNPAYIPNNMLSSLAAGTCGIHYDITALKSNSYNPSSPSAWDPATALDAAYASIIVNGLGLSATIDPLDIIRRGETKQHSVPVTDLDDMICFYISWVKSQANYLGLKLKTPGGSYLPLASPGVSVTNKPNHTIITLNQDILIQPGMSGEWKLEVDGTAVSDSAEHYQFTVINSSDRLKLNTWFDCRRFYAGEAVKIYLELLYKGERVKGIDNILTGGSGPGVSLGNWLASKHVTIAQYNDAMKRMAEEQEPLIRANPGFAKLRKESLEKYIGIQKQKFISGLDPVTIRSWILKNDYKLVYPGRVIIKGQKFSDDGTNGDQHADDGIYTAVYTPRKEGTYHFNISAVESRDGRNILRENQMEVYVHSGIRPRKFIREIKLTDEIVKGFRVYNVVLDLADSQGNIPLPTILNEIKVSLSSGRTMGVVVDNMDGTFTQKIAVPTDINPGKVTMSLTYGELSAKQKLSEKSYNWGYIIGAAVIALVFVINFRRRKR